MNRTLTATEHLMWLSYINSPENVTFSVTVNHLLNPDLLTQALAWLQQRHSRLRVKIIINAQNQPQFSEENVPPIPLRVIHRQGENHWCEEMREELLRPLSWSEEPLMRVLLLQLSDKSHILITFHHCIGDGLSGSYLIRDILQFIGEPDSHREVLPDLPAIDEIIPDIAQKPIIETDGICSKDAKSILAITYQDYHVDNTEALPIRLFHWILPNNETNQILTRCRAENTTFHGALCAAFLLAIAGELNATNDITLRCHTPINIRNYLTIPIGENLGEYITRPVTSHQLNQKTGFWSLAREVKDKLNQVVTQGKLFDDVMKAKSLLSNQTNDNPDARDIGGMDIAITNLGKLNYKQQFGKIRLEEIYLMPTGPKSLPLLIGVTTLQDKMCFICRYQYALIPAVHAHNIKEKAMQTLLASVDV